MEKQEIIPRDILVELQKWLDRREAFAIRGPRQSGKTTLLKILAKMLEGRGKVTLLNFEDPDILEAFERNPKAYIGSFLEGQGRHFFLMDEYHSVRESGRKLKLLYDTFEQAKFVVTGSSSLELGGGMGRFLVGRIFFFELLPFSFHEFLKAKGERLARLQAEKNELVRGFIKGEEVEPGEEVFSREFEPLLHEYLRYGGYPAVVLAEDEETKRMILKGIYDTYISRDVVGFLRFADAFKYRDSVRTLSASLGGLLNYHGLASAVGGHFKEVKRIVSILSETYIVNLVRPFYRNPRTELRKAPKVYFFDLGLRNYVINNFNPPDLRPDRGQLVENFVLLELMRMVPREDIHYWRTVAKAEVDFVLRVGGEPVPVEVKYQRGEVGVPRSLRNFIRAYKPSRALLVTRDFLSKQEVGKTQVLFVPAYCF